MHTPEAIPSRARLLDARSLGAWLARGLSFALLAYVLAQFALHMLVPPPPQRLLLVQDVPLPSGLGATSVGQTDPLAPGVTQQFDHFDFQALDPRTHLLFVAHTGPTQDKLLLEHVAFDPKTDGHLVVVDTRTDRVVGRVDVPHLAGVAVAPDLGKVFTADADDGIIYAIDERTLVPTPIALGALESPDGVSYDSVDRLIIVSDPGMPANPDQTANIDRDNQNVIVIDARTDAIIARINIGHLPKLPQEHAPTTPGDVPTFGYDLGHNVYAATRHRVFVTTQILPDADSPNPNVLPPPGTGELMAIDPVAGRVVGRALLPASCSTPHGLTIDDQQQVAFIACTDVDAASDLSPNLARVDLRTMRAIPANPALMRLAPGPDIVVLDRSMHVLFVACKSGITVFDERSGSFRELGVYQLGKDTHSIAVDEATQLVYLPIFAGGRPVLRIARYYPNGI